MKVEAAQLLRVILRYSPHVCTKAVCVIDDVKTGELFIERRKLLNVSQRMAAAAMGISSMHLCNLERGRAKWTVEFAEKAYKAISK